MLSEMNTYIIDYSFVFMFHIIVTISFEKSLYMSLIQGIVHSGVWYLHMTSPGAQNE